MSDARYCKDCKNINCPENRINCKYPDAIACDLYRDTHQTLFDLLTASPEVLAEKLVYFDSSVCDDDGMGYPWCSTLFEDGGHFETEEKAIDATVAKLKEVAG